MILAVGDKPVRAQIEFELVVLSTLFSGAGNLTKPMVPLIADRLILDYPNESLADFKLCFTRGITGHYGAIQRLDGVTIGVWMKEYLEEKYEAVESKLMKEKENHYQIPDLKDVATDEQAKVYIDQLLKSIESVEAKNSYKMTESEIRQLGAEKPPSKKGTSYVPTVRDQDKAVHIEWYRKQYGASESEAEAWFKSLKK